MANWFAERAARNTTTRMRSDLDSPRHDEMVYALRKWILTKELAHGWRAQDASSITWLGKGNACYVAIHKKTNEVYGCLTDDVHGWRNIDLSSITTRLPALYLRHQLKTAEAARRRVRARMADD